MRYLLAKGADLHIARGDGASCFYIACLMGHEPIARLLYERRAEVFDSYNIHGCTPLWAAASRGHEPIVIWLVNLSFKLHRKQKHMRIINQRGFRGMNASEAARKSGYGSIAAFLEWHMGTGHGERMSNAPCGRQAWVENNGNWGWELGGKVGVLPEDYGFDALNRSRAWPDIEEQLPGHQVSEEFLLDAKPRPAGGLCTTYRLRDQMEESTKGMSEDPRLVLSPRGQRPGSDVAELAKSFPDLVPHANVRSPFSSLAPCPPLPSMRAFPRP